MKILRMADAEASGGAPEVDPMSMPAGEVKIEFPLLPTDRVFRIQIKEPSVQPTKDEKGQVFTCRLVLTHDTTSTKGEVLRAGFPVYHRVGLTPSEKYPATKIAGALAGMLKAVGMKTVTARELINNPQMVADKLADVKFRIQPEKDGYAASNAVSSWVPVN